ncbi:MAG: protein kinase [Acidimicrobiales bacterium]
MTLWASPADGPSTSVGPGTRLGGRYELRRPLASGGMAQVWVGLDTVLDRQVAVKVLHPHLATDTSFVARFRREAVASARLSHPSIVAVFDTVSGNGVEAMVMELIEGRTLRALLDDVGALPIDEVLHVGISIASALDEAHRAGIVHRDIKPANIMVATDHRVLVTDFGIAKAGTDADLTVTGTLLGTAKYLSPEQVTGSNIDPRSDLYSLGVLLFEALTGNVPFKADTDAATALARLHQDPPQLRSLRPNVPPELEAIVAKLMARNPDDRFSRASAVQEALVRLRANQPSSSRPFTGPTPVVAPTGWPAPPAPSSHPPAGPAGRAVPPDPPRPERAVPPTPPPNPPRPGAPLAPTPPLPGARVGPVPPLPGPSFDAGTTAPAPKGGTGAAGDPASADDAARLRPPDPPAGTVAGPPLDPALIAVVSAPTPAGLNRPSGPVPGEAPGADQQAGPTERAAAGAPGSPEAPDPGDIHEAGTVRADRTPLPDRGAQATERFDPAPPSAPDVHEARTIRADTQAGQTTGSTPTPPAPPTTAPDLHEARTIRADTDAGPTVRVDPDPPHRPGGPSSGAVPAFTDGQATVRIPPTTDDPGGGHAGPPSSGSAAVGSPFPLPGPVPPAPPGPRTISGPLLAPAAGDLAVGSGSGPLPVTPDRGGPALERVRRSGRSRVLSLLAVAAIMVVVALLVASGVGPFGTSDDGTPGDGADGGNPGAAIAVVSAASFDPQSRDAEKLEREDLVPQAFDGDRSTAWSTETYRREDFGGLKDGVGLLLTLDETATLSTAELVTNTVGYALEVYVGDSFGPDPSSWGEPAAQVGDGPATASLDLGDARGSTVLIWIRDTGRTGERFRFELAEVTLS